MIFNFPKKQPKTTRNIAFEHEKLININTIATYEGCTVDEVINVFLEAAIEEYRHQRPIIPEQVVIPIVNKKPLQEMDNIEKHHVEILKVKTEFPIEVSQKKVCIKCKKEKNADQFSKDRKRKDGLQNTCKECVLSYQKQWYKNKQAKKSSHPTKALAPLNELYCAFIDCTQSQMTFPKEKMFEYNGKMFHSPWCLNRYKAKEAKQTTL